MNQSTTARLTPNLRLTPSARASPQHRSPAARSPIKQVRDDQCLALKQVIGSTSASNNAFDCSETAACFAFAAGGAAIVAKIDDNLRITQSFFRAKPSAGSVNITTPIYDTPNPFSTPQTLRRGSTLRDSGIAPAIYGSPAQDLDSPSARGPASRERTKAATCVSLSRDGNFVAVGETGYRPRVLIFSTAPNAPTDIPLTAISEHTFGVKCVAFNSDGQLLASLGDVNDGFLYIWLINQRTGSAVLHASNKCTANVKQMAWLGSSLVTVGVRHVKLWRTDQTPSTRTSPSKRVTDFSSSLNGTSRALAGRNCLLGALLDKIFTCIVPIAFGKAVVCSDQGDVCIMDDTDDIPKFFKAADAGFSIQCATVHAERSLIVAGALGEIKLFTLDKLCGAGPDDPALLSNLDDSFRPVDGSVDILAMKSLGDRIMTLDTQKCLQVLQLALDEQDTLSSCTILHRFPAHGGAVLGIQSVQSFGDSDIRFMTYSADGMVLLWNTSGSCVRHVKVPLQQIDTGPQGLVNELKAVRICPKLGVIITGDRYGVLRLMKIADSRSMFEIKAHTGEITAVDIFEHDGRATIASAARDRIVQLFSHTSGATEHVQTLDEHIGAVTGVQFSEDGKRLVSCSSDRTVVVRERLQGRLRGKDTLAYLPARTLTLKAAPLAIDLSSGTGDRLLVSTIDRTFTVFETGSGSVSSSYKAADNDGGESVVVSSAVLVELSRDCWGVAGLSGTDKSIRVYDHTGRLIGREYGHTEGMSGLALIRDETGSTSIITSATDGTVFVWTLSWGVEQLQSILEDFRLASETPPPSSFLGTRPPLRKVLSSSEILQLQQSTGKEAEFGPALSRTRSRSPKRRTSRNTLRLKGSVATDLSSSTRVRNKVETRASPEAASKTQGSSNRRTSRMRAGSPEVPRYQAQTMRSGARTTSMTAASAAIRRPRSASGVVGGRQELNGLATATEQVCRALISYRKKLATTTDVLPLDSVRELERELSTTAKALADKAARNETVMVKLLDQYSERLIGMLDEKIAASVEEQVRRTRESSQEAGG